MRNKLFSRASQQSLWKLVVNLTTGGNLQTWLCRKKKLYWLEYQKHSKHKNLQKGSNQGMSSWLSWNSLLKEGSFTLGTPGMIPCWSWLCHSPYCNQPCPTHWADVSTCFCGQGWLADELNLLINMTRWPPGPRLCQGSSQSALWPATTTPSAPAHNSKPGNLLPLSSLIPQQAQLSCSVFSGQRRALTG